MLPSIHMSRADLHIHTTASDGVWTPTQVVEEAARIGLSAVAMADHDTVGGVEEAVAAGERYGVKVVPAVELNTDVGPVEVHILGYFIDWRSDKLREQLAELRKARLERGRRMVEKLRSLGVPVTLERVLEIAGSGSVGRPHVAQAICETGAVGSINAAFGRYLVRGAPAFVERTKMTPHDAVSIIVDSGGVACFAHPGKTNRDEMIPGLIKSGLRAIEVYYADQSPDITRHYESLARRFGLIATGGSDAHGFDPESGSSIGAVTVDESVVEELLALVYCK